MFEKKGVSLYDPTLTSLYCNLLLLLLYCTPLTWQISISIPLFTFVYDDVCSYCSLSLFHIWLTTIYYYSFSLGSTVSLLPCFPLCLLYRFYSLCSLYVYCIAALSLLSCSAGYDWKLWNSMCCKYSLLFFWD